MNKRRAFTLIELLVVIAIIALLIAILVPSLAMVKEKAKFIQCKVNLRSHFLAMSLYLNEGDDTYPDSFNSLYLRAEGLAVNPNLQCHWHDERINPSVNPQLEGPMWSYLQSSKASMCPTFKSYAKYSTDSTGKSHTDDSTPFNPQYSFSQNAYLGHEDGVFKSTQVSNPSGIIQYVEETIFYISEGAPVQPLARHILNDTNFKARHPGDWSLGDTVATYHQTTPEEKEEGMGNAVFNDGHTELVDPRDTTLQGTREFRSSYLLSFPKRGAMNATKPY
jgi:prepilin-type N-terminal cleavage/methylation domain-containing protein